MSCEGDQRADETQGSNVHRTRVIAPPLLQLQTKRVGLQLEEQHAPLLLHAVPGEPHGVSHQPSEFFTRPAQQSLLVDADPPRGTQALRQAHSWLVVEAPQYGTLAQHSVAPLQVCPLALQLGGARQTPPASKLVPAQQSAGLFARIPSPAQLTLHPGVPVAVLARQNGALAQQGVLVERQAAAELRQFDGVRHTPAESRLKPAQQSAGEAARTPLEAQVVAHMVAEVGETPRQKPAPLQHSLPLLQVAPTALQVDAAWQTPLVHVS